MRHQKRKLLGFDAHVREFPKVSIKADHWGVLDRSGCGYCAIDEMNFRFSIAVQGVEMNRFLVDLNSRARNATFSWPDCGCIHNGLTQH